MGLFSFLFRRRRRRRMENEEASATSRKSRRRWKTQKSTANDTANATGTTSTNSSKKKSKRGGGSTANTSSPTTHNNSNTLQRKDSPTFLQEELTESTHTGTNNNTSPSTSSKAAIRRRGPDLSDGDTAPPPIRSSRSPTGPVDTDHVEDYDDEDDEPQHKKLSLSGSPLEKSAPHISSKPIFHLADNAPPSDDSDDEDASTFNISTDAEDIEYETMRRRLGVISKPPLNNDAISISQETDGETSLFPNLPSEDEFTTGTSTVTKEAASRSILQLNPATGASLVPEPQVPVPQAVKQPPVEPQAFADFEKKFPATKPRKLQAPVKDSPDRRRPKNANAAAVAPPAAGHYTNTFMEAVYGNNKQEDTEFDPFFAKEGNPPTTAAAGTTTASARDATGFADFADFGAFAEKQQPHVPEEPRAVTRSSSASVHNESALEELLAQAKSKKSKKTSISSAPAMTAAYLRQQHNLQRKKETPGVTDIINSLEAANASRRHYRSHSDAASRTSTRSGKSSRRRRASRHRYNSDSDEEESHQQSHDQENWLFDEVTGALGPKGIAADLESLSGRSGNSRRRRRPRHSGNDSVDSSRHSRDSRRSRYSHRSYMSQMSEQSRSVANDLLRLERQLAMVGESSRSVKRAPSRRSRWTVTAPPGKLGIILANKADAKGTVVSGVRTSSALADFIAPGDRIVAIDGEDVSLMTVSEITTIMARKAEYERTLTVLSTREQPPSPSGGGLEK